jgi:protein-disulfide isomerase
LSKLTNPVNGEDHAQGPLDAPTVLVEYGDYQCPHCRAAHAEVKRIERHFGERLCFVYRNFPLTKIHPWAQPAAECAEFSATKGKFWEMHDLLFKNQERMQFELFEELAAKLEIGVSEMKQALEVGGLAGRVRSDFIGGVRSGVNGTPTFFINGERHNGPASFDSLVGAIDATLETATK